MLREVVSVGPEEAAKARSDFPCRSAASVGAHRRRPVLDS